MGSWKVVRLLGTGYYGKVLEIKRNEGNERLALKVINDNNLFLKERELATGMCLRERIPVEFRKHMIEILSDTDCSISPDPYSERDLTQQFENFIITRPVVDSGTLEDFLKNQQPDQATLQRMVGCLITSLAILHEIGRIWHHDIHTKNILIHQGFPIYNDFGLGHIHSTPRNWRTDDFPDEGEPHDSDFEETGTKDLTLFFDSDPEYSDTERIQAQPLPLYEGLGKHGAIPKRAEKDVFSLGGALLDILGGLTRDTKLHPYQSMGFSRSEKLQEKVSNASLRSVLSKYAEDNQYPILMETVKRMLDLDFTTRVTAKEAAFMLYNDDKGKELWMCKSCEKWCKAQPDNAHEIWPVIPLVLVLGFPTTVMIVLPFIFFVIDRLMCGWPRTVYRSFFA